MKDIYRHFSFLIFLYLRFECLYRMLARFPGEKKQFIFSDRLSGQIL